MPKLRLTGDGGRPGMGWGVEAGEGGGGEGMEWVWDGRMWGRGGGEIWNWDAVAVGMRDDNLEWENRGWNGVRMGWAGLKGGMGERSEATGFQLVITIITLDDNTLGH